jgi:hypothetical protein
MMFAGPVGGTFYVNAIYQNAGIYQAQYVPEVAGNYVVHVRLNGLDIRGSPYNALVRPGEISSLNSYTTITS